MVGSYFSTKIPWKKEIRIYLENQSAIHLACPRGNGAMDKPFAFCTGDLGSIPSNDVIRGSKKGSRHDNWRDLASPCR